MFYCPGSYRCPQNKSEGAPGPYIIHADKNKHKIEKSLSPYEKHGPRPPEIRKVSDRFKINLIDEENGIIKKNPLGIKVNTSSKGSMTQELFYNYCKHFVESLPLTQGKKNPVILFLDGHVSRWNLAALRYLVLNNVYPFFLASHTTIWSQPNNNGPIKRLHACIEEATIAHRRWNQAVITYFNSIFFHGWKLFIAKEASDLIAGANNATGAYLRTGLYPFNPLSDSWEEAIDSLGCDNALDTRKQVMEQWEVRIIMLEEGRAILTNDEERKIRTGWCFSDDTDEVQTCEAAKNILLIAKMRGDGILAKWREAREKLLEEKKFDEAKMLTPQNIHITDEGDRAALKLIKFIKATNDLPLPRPESEDERRRQKTFNILNMTAAGTGAIQIEILEQSKKILDQPKLLTSDAFCCSGRERCIVKKRADPKKHTCPICKQAVHATCGIPNPDF